MHDRSRRSLFQCGQILETIAAASDEIKAIDARPELLRSIEFEKDIGCAGQGIPLAPGMEIGYVIRDAHTWEVDPERMASEFDDVYYRGMLEKAWAEAAFVFAHMTANDQSV